MDISKNYDDKNLTMVISGEIDTFTAHDLEQAIDSEIGEIDSLTLDFENLDYISSSGLRVLIIAQKKLQPQDMQLKIINSPELIKDIFSESGLNEIFDIQ